MATPKDYSLKISPQLDKSAANKLDRDLRARFNKMAKDVGKMWERAVNSGVTKGLKNASKRAGQIVTGGGIAAAILNPLDKLNETLDKAVSFADNVDTLAGQFGSTGQQIQKTLGVLEAKGLAGEEAAGLLTKFQTFLGREKTKTPEERVLTGLSGNENTVEAFWKAMTGISAIKDNDLKFAAAAQIFGERPVGKLAELIGSNDLSQVAKQIRTVSDAGITSGANAEQIQAVLRWNRNVSVSQAALNQNPEALVRLQNAQKTTEELNIAYQLKNYQQLSEMTQSINNLVTMVQNGIAQIAPLITTVVNTLNDIGGTISGWVSNAKSISNSKIGKYFGL